MYESADEMARRSRMYDDYNRSWPKVFVGEYAASSDQDGSLQASGCADIASSGFKVTSVRTRLPWAKRPSYWAWRTMLTLR